MDDKFLTAKQVQELLHVDRTTIYRMLKDGRLTGIKVGQQWRFSASEVDDLLAGVLSMEEGPAYQFRCLAAALYAANSGCFCRSSQYWLGHYR